MPAPPSKGESQEKFISRCISYLISNEKKTQSQAAGQCYGMWRQAGRVDKKAKSKMKKHGRS